MASHQMHCGLHVSTKENRSWGKIDDIHKPLTESVQYVIVCKSSNNFEAQKLSMNCSFKTKILAMSRLY